MVDDSITSAVRVGASIGGGIGGAVGVLALIWRYGRRLLDWFTAYFGGETDVGYIGNGLGRLRGEVSQDIGVQLGNLEDRLMGRLMEVRTELRQNVLEMREDLKEHKKETNGRFAELQRRRTR